MSILCAADFSDFAHQGARVAALWARRRQVPLRLLHATSAKEGSREAWAAQAALEGEAERLAALGASVQPLLRFGSPHGALLECIEQEPPSLVIAGAPAHDSSLECCSRYPSACCPGGELPRAGPA